MNGFKGQRRTKRVSISFEWTTEIDLKLILSDLKDLIGSGVETYHNQKKSIHIEDKWHELEFRQEYVDKVHESTESDINGELKLVIKSNF